MTLPTTGNISISQIHAEFGYGQKLSDYVGKKWYKADGTEGTFSNPIKLSDFYGTAKLRILHKLSYTVSANDTRTFAIITATRDTSSGERNLLKDAGWDRVTKFELNLTINASRYIGGILQSGNFPAGSVVNLVINSGGGVYGTGGAGGFAHNNVGPQEGSAGGDAIFLGGSGVKYNITNNGTIGGGGGGGGGAGGYPSTGTGAGGGGGAGAPGGTGAATGGSNGTLTVGGAGGTTGNNKGGKGGNLGQAGSSGTGDRAKAGGAGGYALRGGSGRVTWIKTGTRIGTVA